MPQRSSSQSLGAGLETREELQDSCLFREMRPREMILGVFAMGQVKHDE
jgi:hypothetical protein